VSDPEKLLKPKGYLKQTVASTGKVYQPKVTQVNAKVQIEELTPKESFKQVPSAEASTSKPEAKLENPEVIVPEIKVEIDLNDTPTSQNKKSLSIPAVIDTLTFPPLPEVKVSVSRNSEEYILYPDSSPIGSPIYTSCKSEETNPHFPFPPLLYFPSPNDLFPELPSPHPEVVERSPLQSLEVFENPLFSPRSSSPRLPMAGVGGTGGGGAGGQGQGQALPPRIFSKVAARYAPLVLPVVLHDLPKNYMKNLPKFMGEGDLTATEHIAFFISLLISLASNTKMFTQGC
jgi:hypothetical protein